VQHRRAVGEDKGGKDVKRALLTRPGPSTIPTGRSSLLTRRWRKTDSNPLSLFDRSSCDGNAAGGEEDGRKAAQFLVKKNGVATRHFQYLYPLH